MLIIFLVLRSEMLGPQQIRRCDGLAEAGGRRGFFEGLIKVH
jgi:hypothetical protein